MLLRIVTCATLILGAVAMFNAAPALSRCTDTPVAELELMEDTELWREYCRMAWEADAQRKMAMDILHVPAAEQAPVYAIHISEEYEAEWKKCLDVTTRIGRVLRAKYELEEPNCDGMSPVPNTPPIKLKITKTGVTQQSR